MDARSRDLSTVRAWDLPTRVFHWSLVVLMAAGWASAEFAEQLGDVTLKAHRWTGYAILVLLVWRLIWGFTGSPTSRFSSFVVGPGAVLRYGLDLLRGRSRYFLGHNPLGALMVLALIGIVLTQTVLGLFTVEHNDLANGPLANLVDERLWKPIRLWHHWIFNRLILPLAALHILANILYGVVKKDPLIPAMITGRKPAADYEDDREPVGNPNGRALGCLAVAAALVFGPIWMLGGTL